LPIKEREGRERKGREREREREMNTCEFHNILNKFPQVINSITIARGSVEIQYN
jgi:hypothetical protein